MDSYRSNEEDSAERSGPLRLHHKLWALVKIAWSAMPKPVKWFLVGTGQHVAVLLLLAFALSVIYIPIIMAINTENWYWLLIYTPHAVGLLMLSGKESYDEWNKV